MQTMIMSAHQENWKFQVENVSTKKPLVAFYTIKAMQLLITAILGNVTCSSVPQEVDNCNLKAS